MESTPLNEPEENGSRRTSATHPPCTRWRDAAATTRERSSPNHEALLPNYAVADERLNAFQTLYGSTPDLDMDAELDKLEEDLSVIFQDAE